MAHIVFAVPAIGSFRLMERLRTQLQRRDHRVSILCTERSDFSFWREQCAAVDLLAARRHHLVDPRALETVGPTCPARTRRRLPWLAGAATPWFERERPDLVLFHETRSADAQVVRRAAEDAGGRVLWTGAGLLAHTMQLDDHGIDAAAGCRRWSAKEYRVVEPDDELLRAALGYALAGIAPLALPSAAVQVPPAARRLLDALTYGLEGRAAAAAGALTSWRAAVTEPPAALPRLGAPAPHPPFLAVLLQPLRDPRLAPDQRTAAYAEQLVRGALQATRDLDVETGVAVVTSTDRCPSGVRQIAARHPDKITLLSAEAAAPAAATAAAVVTVNHPAAMVGLLASTPVVHTGDALYELRGVTARATADSVSDAVLQALTQHRPALRRRFLTWLLRYGHVWCSTTSPSFNGMLGLVEAVEQRLSAAVPVTARPLAYQPGPCWPLQTSGRAGPIGL